MPITTVHGQSIPESDLEHIAPALRSLAVEVTALDRDDNNSRKHGEKSVVACARSLKRFGQQKPIIFDPATKTIIAGNGSHEAAEEVLRWKYIAAIPTDLPSIEQRAFSLADNRTAEMSQWNIDKLREQLEELEAIAPSDLYADLETIGLSDDDLKSIEQLTKYAAKASLKSVEGKEIAESDKKFQVVITCASADHKNNIVGAINRSDGDALTKLLHGCQVREKVAES